MGACYIYLDFIYWELAFVARNGRFFQIMVGVLCSMYSGYISTSFPFFFDFLLFICLFYIWFLWGSGSVPYLIHVVSVLCK